MDRKPSGKYEDEGRERYHPKADLPGRNFPSRTMYKFWIYVTEYKLVES